MNPPKPTALKLLEGNAGKRQLPKHEPRLAVGAPECPEWVTGSARAHWSDIAQQLKLMGVATSADKYALGLMVDALGDYIAAKKTLEEQGDTFTSEKGYVGVHPCVAIRTNAWERILKALREFGLTPSSRTRVASMGEGKRDEFEDFLEKKA